jgi:hypothetical protein
MWRLKPLNVEDYTLLESMLAVRLAISAWERAETRER